MYRLIVLALAEISNSEAQNYNPEEKTNLDKEMYWKEIFYIVHVITLEDTQQKI